MKNMLQLHEQMPVRHAQPCTTTHNHALPRATGMRPHHAHLTILPTFFLVIEWARMNHNHLVILPCHSIWQPYPHKISYGENKDEWHLAPFQVEGQDHLCFIDHIKKSFGALRKNPHALLVISGGQTKADAGPISEALTYYQLAQRLLREADYALLKRVVLEEYARDSFENVLFLICRFYEITQRYPDFITVVGFEFKRTRFIKHHLSRALKFPESRVEYIGNLPMPGEEIDHEKYFSELMASEEKHALQHFATDLYGIRGPLQAKKSQRDPSKRYHGYESSNPGMSDFLGLLRSGCSSLTDEEIGRHLHIDWGTS